MKKLVLVPEPRFRALVESESKNSSAGMMEALINPEREEMVKKFHIGQTILNDPAKEDDVKMMEYDNAMQGFATQRDKVKMKSAPKPPPVVPDESDVKKTLHEKTINSLPTNLQPTAKKLLERVRDYGDKRIISLSSSGEVSVNGQRLAQGADSILDLVSDILRAPSTKRVNNPNRRAFLEALVKMNVPEAWIKNKSARAEFQFLKRNNVVDKKASRTPPKGIPEHLLTKKDLSEDEKLDSDSATSSVKKRTTAAVRSRKGLSARKKSSVVWVETD